MKNHTFVILTICLSFAAMAEASIELTRAQKASLKRTTKCVFSILKKQNEDVDQSYLAQLIVESLATHNNEISTANEKCLEYKDNGTQSDFSSSNQVGSQSYQQAMRIIDYFQDAETDYQCTGINLSADVAAVVGIGVRSAVMSCATNNLRLYPIVLEESVYYTLGLGTVVSVSWEDRRGSNGLFLSSSEFREYAPYTTANVVALGGLHFTDGGYASSGGGDIDDLTINGGGVGWGVMLSQEHVHLPIPLYPRVIDWRSIYSIMEGKQ